MRSFGHTQLYSILMKFFYRSKTKLYSNVFYGEVLDIHIPMGFHINEVFYAMFWTYTIIF